MRMYPFWKLKGAEGIYELRGFVGYVENPQTMLRTVLWIFDHMGGGLTEARPGNTIHEFATEAKREEVMKLYPEAWEEWRNLPEENL